MKNYLLILLISSFANLQSGCALRVYDQGKLAIADYGDTDGNMHYKSSTGMEFSFVGKRNVSKPTRAGFRGVHEVTADIITGVVTGSAGGGTLPSVIKGAGAIVPQINRPIP